MSDVTVDDDREELPPGTFDHRCRLLERRFPDAHQTSGRRNPIRNAAEGSSPDSKHLYGMARDYALVYEPDRDDALRYARHVLGLWVKPYDWGIHVQGLPTGDPSAEWVVLYGELTGWKKLKES